MRQETWPLLTHLFIGWWVHIEKLHRNGLVHISKSGWVGALGAVKLRLKTRQIKSDISRNNELNPRLSFKHELLKTILPKSQWVSHFRSCWPPVWNVLTTSDSNMIVIWLHKLDKNCWLPKSHGSTWVPNRPACRPQATCDPRPSNLTRITRWTWRSIRANRPNPLGTLILSS